MEHSLRIPLLRASSKTHHHRMSGGWGYYIRLTLCLAFLFFIAPAAKATHYHGGAIYYNYLGDGRYEIYSKTYWSKDEVAGIIYRYQGLPKLESAVKTVSKTLMPDGLTVEHLQKQTVRWSQPGTYEVYWKNCCRSVGTNFDNNEIGLFAVINYAAGTPSSSPVFNGFPTLQYQPGHRLAFSVSLSDPEGQEQVYSLVKPHSSPDSVYNKMLATGFSVNAQGLVSWEKPVSGKWLVNVRIHEKVNGILTGAYIQQDFVITVASCVLPAPTYTIATKPCLGAANGKIIFDVPEGVAPFKFSIDDGKTLQDSPEFNNLPRGYFTGVVVDANGCASHHVHIKLEEAAPTQVTFMQQAAACYNSGGVKLSGGYPAGGVYQGAGVQEGVFYPEVAGVGTHALTYTYTDTSGCATAASATITVSEALVANAGPGALVYYGYEPQSCASLTASATGGAAPYTYQWSTGETSQSIQVCPAVTTTYEVLVTDALGCTSSTTTTVTVQDVRAVEPATNVNKPDFIVMCKDGKEMEVQSKNVDKALEKGATLGACNSSSAITQARTSKLVMNQFAAAADMQLLVYPNPVPYKGLLKLRINKAEAVKIELINLSGKLVKLLYQGNTLANQEIVVELDKNVKGSSVYFLRVTTPSEQLNYKLMVL